jgi:hypothetical protein
MPDLRTAVAVAGYHYNTNDDSGGNFKQLAEAYDKEVWNSEAQATFSNSRFRPNNNTPDPKPCPAPASAGPAARWRWPTPSSRAS